MTIATRGRLAALSLEIASAIALTGTARRNTSFTTDFDPLKAKSGACYIDDDTDANTGGPGTDAKSDSDGTVLAKAEIIADPNAGASAQLQAENADGGTKQADAIDDAGAGNKAAVGDPPAGSEQQS